MPYQGFKSLQHTKNRLRGSVPGQVPDPIASQFLACARIGDLQGLKDHLRTHPSLLNMTYNHSTALTTAGEANQLAVVMHLLSVGAIVDLVPTEDGSTALELAAKSASAEVVQRLLMAGADVNKSIWSISRALIRKEERMADMLLNAGARFEIRQQGADALCLAAGWVSPILWRKLLEAGASFRGMDRIGIYALFSAESEEWAKLIVEDAELDLTAVEAEALMDAVKKKKVWMVNYLIRNGVRVSREPELESSRIKGLVHTAVKACSVEIVRALLEAGADVDALSMPGYGMARVTALYVAVANESEEMVDILLSAGADVERRDQRGRTILHCKSFFQTAIFNLVVKRKPGFLRPSTVNLRDHHGYTPLHIAAQQGSMEALERLVEAGADIHLADNHRVAALGHALKEGHAEKVKFLLSRGADITGVYMDNWRNIMEATPAQHVWIFEDTKGYKRLQLSKTWNRQEFYHGECGPGRSLFSQYGADVQTHQLDRNIFNELDALKHSGGYGVSPILELEEPAVMDWLLWEGTQLTQKALFRDLELVDVQNHFAISESKAQFTFRIRLGYFFHQPWFDIESDMALHSFSIGVRYQEIAWTMGSSLCSDNEIDAGREPRVKSFKFMSSLRYGWLPRHGVEFFAMLITEIENNWKEVFDAADMHLKKCHKELLSRRGRSTDLIEHLLHDAQTWGLFRDYIDAHSNTAERFVKFCGEHSFLYEEVEVLRYASSVPGGRRYSGNLEAWNELSMHSVTVFTERCEARLLRLEEKTRELIQLEFNLVSIYEAQRSTSMAASMKRLSWITFVFLPLMFVATLFGMNIDLLQENPSWRWFILLSLVVTVLVMAVWGLFKSTNLETVLYSLFEHALFKWDKNRETRRKRSGQDEAEVGLLRSKTLSASSTWGGRKGNRWKHKGKLQ